MNGVAELVSPYAALVLVKAHAPEAQKRARLVAHQVGQILQALLKGSETFVGVALGEFGNEVERVGGHALLEFFKRDCPMLTSAGTTVLLFNHFTFGATLSDGFVFIQGAAQLLGECALFAFTRPTIRIAQAVTNIGHACGEEAVLVDEVHVDRIAFNDFTQEVVHDGQVGAGLKDDHIIRERSGVVAERRQADHFRVGVSLLAT